MKKRISLIIKLAVLLAIIACTSYVAVKYGKDIVNMFKNPVKAKNYLRSYGSFGVMIFILFQIVQVVVAVIPGEVIQVAGGYVYGTFWGTVFSLIGLIAGTMIAYYITRILGYSALKTFIPQKKFEKFNSITSSSKFDAILFLLFLIPGFPKDMLAYLSGLTSIAPKKFFIIVTIARLPALIGSSFVGSRIQQQRYISVIVVSVIACILFLIGVFNKDKIINRLNHVIKKKSI